MRILLTIVGGLYVLFGLWCTFSPEQTSVALGYRLSGAAWVEYLVVYGGLELGLGTAMVLGARQPTLVPGVFFMSTVFSLCLPVYRFATLLFYPLTPGILAALVVEFVIAASFVIVALRRRP